MKEFITKVDKLFVPKGTKVTHDDGPGKDNVGKTGKLLCGVPSSGALFYDENELDKVK